MDDLRFFARRVLRFHSDVDAGAHWRGLSGGGWRIVDHFEAGGRRYVIARRRGCRGLDPRQTELLARRARGEPLKNIACDFGISVSAVSRRLAVAMRAIGVRSHAELAQLLGDPADFGSSAPK